MARSNPFRILVATDGSRVAAAAVRTAVHFPWPSPSSATGVTARFVRDDYRRSVVLAALDRTAEAVAAETARLLRTRWPEADARVVEGAAGDVIAAEARRTRADVIVVGWRGQGAIRRLLTGSVSRAVVRQAPCPVLVTRKAVRTVSTIVIGIDGSSHSLAAFDFVARLPPDGRRVVLFSAIETLQPPSQVHLTRAIRGTVASEVQRINRQRRRDVDQSLQQMKRQLKQAGWSASTVVSTGDPLRELLRQVAKSRASLLVVGARGATALDRLLLGSVADGALDRSPVPVLVVK